MTYLKYLWYLIKHKWYVGKFCLEYGLYWKAIIHDWSKFLPSEFIPYARNFFGPERTMKVKEDFKVA